MRAAPAGLLPGRTPAETFTLGVDTAPSPTPTPPVPSRRRPRRRHHGTPERRNLRTAIASAQEELRKHASHQETANAIERALHFAVNHSGDSDSTGAITGNLLGTRLGVDAIPEDLIEELESHDLIEELARDFAIEMHMEEDAPPS